MRRGEIWFREDSRGAKGGLQPFSGVPTGEAVMECSGSVGVSFSPGKRLRCAFARAIPPGVPLG